VEIHRLFAVRDFFIANEDGETIAISTINWLVIDFKRRKPVRVDEYLKKMYLLPDIRAINQLLDKPICLKRFSLNQDLEKCTFYWQVEYLSVVKTPFIGS